jgi:hypothetical protein
MRMCGSSASRWASRTSSSHVLQPGSRRTMSTTSHRFRTAHHRGARSGPV